MPGILAWLDTAAQEKFFLFLHSTDPHAPYTPQAPYDLSFSTNYTGRFSPEVRGDNFD